MPKYEIGQIVGIWKVLGYNHENKHGIRYVTQCTRCGYINPSKDPGNMEVIPKNVSICEINGIHKDWPAAIMI